MTQLFLNLVTAARLKRNPTIKEEISARGFECDFPAGFQCYPLTSAAHIAAFRPTLVPVGADQAPIIEQANEIVRRLNRQVWHALLTQARALIPANGRLPRRRRARQDEQFPGQRPRPVGDRGHDLFGGASGVHRP